MTNSVKMNTPVEIIKTTAINPLISKCQIKVCYVGDEPNRNRSVITKETGRQLANTLPGSPIVGYYNEDKGDFEGHNRELVYKNGKMYFKDVTRPYGFVDLNARVWFQKFLDNGVEHEYLMTEGYLWTGQYPEAKRIIEKGNNQSMELDEEKINAYWTKDNKGKPQFFIINEAIISKLCTLGTDVEPCFEGADVTAPKITFSFEDSFKEELFSMMNQMKEILNEGGLSVEDIKVTETAVEEIALEEATVVEETVEVEEEVVAEPVVEEKVEEVAEETVEEPVVEATEESTTEVVEETAPTTEFAEEVCPECEKPVSKCECDKEEKEEEKEVKYTLEEIPEYVDLASRYSNLEQEFNTLTEKYNSLVEFKRQIDRKEKEAMIAKFYMLSDEDKKDVIENIDTYSIDDIEAKLSIICVRNRVSFDLDENKEETKPITYNLHEDQIAEDAVPAWIKSVRAVAKNMK